MLAPDEIILAVRIAVSVGRQEVSMLGSMILW